MNTVQTITMSESDRNELNVKRKIIPFEFIDSEVNSFTLSQIKVLKPAGVPGKFIDHDNYGSNFELNSRVVQNCTHYFNRIL